MRTKNSLHSCFHYVYSNIYLYLVTVEIVVKQLIKMFFNASIKTHTTCVLLNSNYLHFS